MKIDILDIDKLIEVNKLQEVTSPRIFSNNLMFDPDGILSYEIFGISKDDRRSTFAYIDLKRKFINPHIYEKVIKPIYRNIMYIVSGQKRFSIVNGFLEEDSENGWTGIDELYNNWDKINWDKSTSAKTINKNLLNKLSRDQVFLDKYIVIPPAYRDVMMAGMVDNSDYVNELNKLYTLLIRTVALLAGGGLFTRVQYATQNKIQDILVDIPKYLQSQIEKKNGLIRKNLMGKSIDFGTRAVISAPTYNHTKFGDSMVDLEHSAVPIAQCCSMFYPFIEAWLKNFFTREVINDPNLVSFHDKETNKIITAKMIDPEIQFSEKNIKKMIDNYVLNPDNRFEIISIDLEDPKVKNKKIKAYMHLKGKVITSNNTEELLKRPMTITDILYLACVDVCEHRHGVMSRYPVGIDKGIVLTKIRVSSTRKHIKIKFNDKIYNFYPDIDLNTEHEKVGIQFIDTLVISNSHLDGMGK